jgi:alginate O-acetyltransferase complex protein AlgI
LYVASVVIVGWVFFRLETIPEALTFLTAMAGRGDARGLVEHVGLYWNAEVLTTLFAALLGSTPLLPLLLRLRASLGSSERGESSRVAGDTLEVAGAVGLACVLLACMMSTAAGTYDPFIYFRF